MSASHNTALFEIKIMAMILDEAKRRGFCHENPCRNLKLKKNKPDPKLVITEADIELIRRELLAEPEWMRVSFEIAILHGTRLRATCINLERDVDWKTRRITFHEKGGKIFTVPIHPELLPVLEKLKASGRTTTCDIPKDASKKWRRFFKRIGRKDYCFHCCRVTVITRLAQSGVSEAKAMKYVGHACTEIHRQYQALSVEDLACCHEPLRLPRVNPEDSNGASGPAPTPVA
jgi:integrase